jgi:hypothetical protein
VDDSRQSLRAHPRSGGWSSGPAILLWGASAKTTVERNLIVDSFRGIALGLAPGGTPYARNGIKEYDHLGGIIRQNVLVNMNGWADEAIEANGTRETRIEHNTVLVEGTAGWSIGVRFPNATALVRNNLTNRPILERNGGHATSAGNIFDAARTWFVDPARADLHLTGAAGRAIDAGVAIPDIDLDFDRRPRVTGRAPDVGAFEAPPRGSGRR